MIFLRNWPRGQRVTFLFSLQRFPKILCLNWKKPFLCLTKMATELFVLMKSKLLWRSGSGRQVRDVPQRYVPSPKFGLQTCLSNSIQGIWGKSYTRRNRRAAENYWFRSGFEITTKILVLSWEKSLFYSKKCTKNFCRDFEPWFTWRWHCWLSRISQLSELLNDACKLVLTWWRSRALSQITQSECQQKASIWNGQYILNVGLIWAFHKAFWGLFTGFWVT